MPLLHFSITISTASRHSHPDVKWRSVVAYFNEDVKILSDTIHQVVKRLPLFSRHRVIVYAKNGDHTEEALEFLLPIADEVTWLENVGREGDTYLVSRARPIFFLG